MSADSVYWGEGEFLRPQHFQETDRIQNHGRHRSLHWTSRYSYGVYLLEIDDSSLANWRIDLRKCHLRFRDGTQLCFPDDCHISPIVIPKELFVNQSKVPVYVGIPELRRGANNVAAPNNKSEPCRYVLHEEEVEDQNRARNPQRIKFRKLNPVLLLGDKSTNGYDVVPIMQLRLGATAEAPPQIDQSYFPPSLCKEAWEPLDSFVKSVGNYLGAMSHLLASQMPDRGVAFESGHREDLERILRLHAVNSALGGYSALTLAAGTHPLDVYRGLCQAVGELAIFRGTRSFPDLVPYDHDDLAFCLMHLRDLLQITGEEQPYERVPFSAAGLQMTVRLEERWLAPDWSFYVGVYSPLPNEKIKALLTRVKELDMKAGSTEKVDSIFIGGYAGVGLIPVADPPRALPGQNWHYFMIDRNDVEWTAVERTHNFGLRFNETKVQSRLKGEDKIDVKDIDNSTTTLKFSMFAIQSKKT